MSQRSSSGIVERDKIEQTLEDHPTAYGHEWKSGILYVGFREGAFVSTNLINELEHWGVTVRNIDLEKNQIAFEKQ